MTFRNFRLMFALWRKSSNSPLCVKNVGQEFRFFKKSCFSGLNFQKNFVLPTTLDLYISKHRHLSSCKHLRSKISSDNYAAGEKQNSNNSTRENLDFESESQEVNDDDDEDQIEKLLKYDPSLYRAHRIKGVGHNVILIQPKVKWGPKKRRNTTPQLQLEEAVALVETLPDWRVVEKLIIPVSNPDVKMMFGKGNLEKITKLVKDNPLVSAVFISYNILSSTQQSSLEKLLGYPVYDRYSIVLQIFHEHARTKEAKLQVALAEIPYIRACLKDLFEKGKDREGGGNRYISGSGESFLERKKRILLEREAKIRKKLDDIRRQRKMLRTQRIKKEFPVVAIVGYTNSGKTSLIKALTQDATLEPKNQLFATLDVTAHAGMLPSYQKVLYMDTVGFIADIPTTLIESFTATLEDVILADLIVHIRDVSHPDRISQKETVLRTLQELQLSNQLLETILEVGNKVDLVESAENLSVEGDQNEMYLISATKGTGLKPLQAEIEKRILQNTGRTTKTFRVPSGGTEARWLYKEAGVKSVIACNKDPNYLLMQVIITKASASKFISYFGDMAI